ncbi:helix-turn-helix domain-containing protein [Nocardia cyriacigeorgica]|uniref:helix-turn-helix domain-containing protein n=1 Tax=Nocardia cyriacigeorgica TaxID=135487 RepID=UPI001894B15D|nr:helix-turn-helix domain-containing protein [Nocardia cyriacigeorgica]MBF6452988.1 helix-turn-helix domain-containing protein [Nocardia cyriacigeorgica]MBF6480373.1 helix-turn-helix domain-containing protein [Nocardia cyriacigeorgica]MBF6550157.1 helix-turn-helix domain-containing protein [Nocardia cyriacigeorgica]
METLHRDGRATVSVSPREVEQAREVLASADGAAEAQAASVTLSTGDGQCLRMPPELSALVMQIVELIGRGSTVTIGTIPDEVTTTAAAQMLRVSRPSLMKLVRENKIPAHKVGSHTRLYSRDVLAFRRSQLERQSKAFDELRAMEEEWGVLD